ncbi:HTH-type transcriptional regulator hipB [Escherichia coli UMEA 3268-1]|nr:HTH-type transcriptional regulator hipB [Escherichia coli UMEA 3264-1]EQY77891.1 HTH-type transcriptional regulator hipB [Escherichia coli UMEA 3268-1]
MMSFQKIYSPTQLANAMKLVRQQNGWTQSELAKKIGIKQATISNFENNPDNTSLTTFPSSVKYESDGGPGIAQIMAFLMGSSEALKDRYDFMKFQVFQWLIGATDGHAKNFSVFIQAGGSYRLTPFYDIISAFPVLGGTGIHISDLKLAMGLNASKGKKTAIDKIYPRHFLATAKVLKFPEVQMHEILSDFARMIPAALDNVKNSLPTDFPERILPWFMLVRIMYIMLNCL